MKGSSQKDQPSQGKSAVNPQSSKKVYKPGPTSKAINSTIRGVNTKSHGIGYSSTNSQGENQKDQDQFAPLPLIRDPEEKKKAEESESKSKPSQSGATSEKKEEVVSGSDQRGDSLSFSMKSIDRVDTLSEISDDASKESKTVSEKKEEPEQQAQGLDLEENVIIELRETETFTLFAMPSRAVKDDAPARPKVVQMNEAYQNLIKEKYASDSYQGRAAQTSNPFTKTKEASSESLRVEDATTGASEWEIYDTFAEEAPDAKAIILKEFNEEVARAFKENMKTQGLLLDADSYISATAMSSVSQSVRTSEKLSSSKGAKSSQRPDQSSRSVMSSSHSINASKNSAHSSAQQQGDETTPFKPPEDVKLPVSMIEKFNIVERILTQNTYLEEQILYRNYPKIEFAKREIEDETLKNKAKAGTFNLLQFRQKVDEKVEEEVKESTDPELKDLFQFHCPLTQDRRICCADWNSKNADLLAVAYGEFNHVDSKKEGLLLFWTLKSPRFPEHSIKTSTGLVSCEFSKRSPNLIATGSYDGIVSLYDLRVRGNKPIADSSEVPGKHIDTVWEVRWADTGSEEDLLSISSDGKVYQWSVKKGLEFKTLLTLKKPSNPNMKDGREGPVFREAVGFSVDPADNSIYYVSTEEGSIHKCSFSYTEELETYWGHTGPVYKVRCSPFYREVFLSCSADWTCQLWHTRKEEAVMSCHSMDLTDAVNDVEWSPSMSTIFSSCADDGRIEVWDIAQSTLKPLIYRKLESEAPRTIVRFCPEFPVLISGNTAGVIDVFRIKNLEQEQITPAEQRRRLEAAINTNSANEEAKVEDEEEKV